MLLAQAVNTPTNTPGRGKARVRLPKDEKGQGPLLNERIAGQSSKPQRHRKPFLARERTLRPGHVPMIKSGAGIDGDGGSRREGAGEALDPAPFRSVLY
jgi:hypothetical protein